MGVGVVLVLFGGQDKEDGLELRVANATHLAIHLLREHLSPDNQGQLGGIDAGETWGQTGQREARGHLSLAGWPESC